MINKSKDEFFSSFNLILTHYTIVP